jgi:hypothetical protein
MKFGAAVMTATCMVGKHGVAALVFLTTLWDVLYPRSPPSPLLPVAGTHQQQRTHYTPPHKYCLSCQLIIHLLQQHSPAAASYY